MFIAEEGLYEVKTIGNFLNFWFMFVPQFHEDSSCNCTTQGVKRPIEVLPSRKMAYVCVYKHVFTCYVCSIGREN